MATNDPIKKKHRITSLMFERKKEQMVMKEGKVQKIRNIDGGPPSVAQ